MARVIKDEAQLTHTDLVLLSSVCDVNLSENESKTLFSRYLTKPARQSQIYNCLVSLFHNRMLTTPQQETNSNLTYYDAQVLVAEDNLVNQAVAIEMLGAIGCTVDMVENGQLAIAAIEQQAYDIIFMDCQMPVLDGFQATKAIRHQESESDRHLPIIALTANAVQGDRDICIASGMDDYLAKPFTMTQLRELLDKWLADNCKTKKRIAAREREASAEALHAMAVSDDELKHLDPTVIKQLKSIVSGDSSTFIRNILTNYLGSGDKALKDLTGSVSSGNLRETGHLVHSLKSSSANIGAQRLSELCRRLEEKTRNHNTSDIQQDLTEIVEEYARVESLLRRHYSEFLVDQVTQEDDPEELSHCSAYVVLVVDDDSNMRLVAKNVLQEYDFRVCEAVNGHEAVETFKRVVPDLVLMDVEMPVMGGFMACSLIRDLKGGDSVPILMMTGHDDIASIDKAYHVGATDFVTKPLNWVILMHRLRYMMRAKNTLCQLKHSEARLESAQKMAAIGDWVYDYVNESLTLSNEVYRLHGMSPDVTITHIDQLFDRVHPDEQSYVRAIFQNALESHSNYDLEYRIMLPEGGERIISTQGHIEADEEGKSISIAGTFQDVTTRKKAEQRISMLAKYDSLTELPNRRFFKESLTLSIELANTQNTKLAILFIDLDNFKQVNDTLGHSSGDQLLRSVSRRLQASIRRNRQQTDSKSDGSKQAIARLGGDEFVVLLTDVKNNEDAKLISNRIIENLSRPVILDTTEVRVTASIGIALFPDHGKDPETMIRNADMAMYHAKSQGRNNCQFYSKDLNVRAMERLSLEGALRKAIENQEFTLHYQPLTELSSGQIIAVEALLRWHSPALGNITPARFIPVAEETGLINDLGSWVFREVCSQIKYWDQNGFDVQKVTVNLSGVQFKKINLVTHLTHILEMESIEASRIQLELTESVIMSSASESIKLLHRLKDVGFSLAVDDFGTGYSSLGYLKRFPIDVLKVDRSFVKDIPDDPNDVAIVEAVIAMSRKLGLKVVAEGVETEEQMTFLEKLGCDYVQGFLISRPVPPIELEKLLYSSGQEYQSQK